MTKLFVYGRLTMNSHYYQHYLQEQKFLGKGFIDGYKRYFLGGLHGIIAQNGGRVEGEVYEIDPPALARLDFLHNQGRVYTRTIVDVNLENGETMTAETYLWNSGDLNI